jgi:RND family efflux transporter MFP subunit
VNKCSGFSIRARALIENPEHLFTPGMLARVKLQGSGKYTATLIDDEAVATDQDRKYVMVVNAQNAVEYRPVELGGIHDNRRIVRSGLQQGERVVVGGLQRVRPGMTVAPQEVATANAEAKPQTELSKNEVRKVAAAVGEEKPAAKNVQL